MKNSFKESKPESNQGSTIRLQETQGAEEQAKLQGHSHQNPECRKFIRAKKNWFLQYILEGEEMEVKPIR